MTLGTRMTPKVIRPALNLASSFIFLRLFTGLTAVASQPVMH
jgi:hypothetical protein